MIGRARARRIVVLACLGLLTLATTSCATTHPRQSAEGGHPLAWPVASLLSRSTDLGPSTRADIASVVALNRVARPVTFERWARRHNLRAGWRPGHSWASLSGSAPAMGAALGVSVHDYRSRTGQDFYAALRQPVVPAAIRGEVTQMGRLLNYTPQVENAPSGSVALGGLSPDQLATAYDANDLQRATSNTTRTIVFFEVGGYQQSDVDALARAENLPKISTQLIGGPPSTIAEYEGETELDLEVAHAIAPHARLVIANALPTFNGSSANTGLAIGQLFTKVDQEFPGAVWSLSIAWGCEQMFTSADLQPVESALETAESHGTSAFDASGDTAGLECKNNDDWSTPPSDSDVGVDAVASLPAMTSTGGTRLSTGANGQWIAEQAWDYSSLSQGSAGGVSRLQTRPSWQVAPDIASLRGSGHRLVPDVSADADPDTGVATVMKGSPGAGGGTSQAAPIWAGFTLLMDAYLQSHGGKPIGAFNPVAYRVAEHPQQPAFHDITLGADAVDRAKPGYDLVTGLGSPMYDNLVQDILGLQRSGS